MRGRASEGSESSEGIDDVVVDEVVVAVVAAEAMEAMGAMGAMAAAAACSIEAWYLAWIELKRVAEGEVRRSERGEGEAETSPVVTAGVGEGLKE